MSRFIKLSEEHIAIGWLTGNYSANIKPKISGLSTSLIAKVIFKLVPDKSFTPWEKIPPEALSGDLTVGGDPMQGLGYASDFVPYKPVADFSAVATAYPPEGAKGSFVARMRVGSREKVIKVYGERSWTGEAVERPGEPEELTPVPITYANAWGGPLDPMNPLGCGRTGKPIPRLELPENPILDRQMNEAAAVFSPMSPNSPYRKSKTGTYDQEWVDGGWPWLPSDFDYSFYNATHPSQWMEGYLRGDEELEFTNMHPTHPVYQTRLPGIRVRCFVNRITNWSLELHPDDAVTAFEEVPMNLDTLWVDMEKEKLVLIWRGRTPVKSLKRRDLQSLFLLTEPLKEPDQPDLGLQHYYQLYLEELGTRPDTFSTRKPLDPEGFRKKHGIKTAVEIREQVHTELHKGFTEGMKLKEAAIQAASKKLAPLEKYAPAKVAAIREKLQKHLSEYDPISRYLANAEDLPRPRPLSISESMAQKDELFAQGVARGEQQFQKALSNPMLSPAEKAKTQAAYKQFEEQVAASKERNEEMNAKFLKMKETMGSLLPPTKHGEDFFPGGVPDWEKIRREGLTRTVLDGMDLSGVDFTGIDFSGSSFHQTLLRGSKLTGANFSKALMIETDLTNADLSGALLDHVNLTSCKVTGTIWCEASLTRANLSFLKLSGSDFSGAKGESTNFTGTELAGANFCRSNFFKSHFTNALLEKADFTKASLVQCSMITARASEIVMDDAILSKLGGGHGADFSGGSFKRVSAVDSSWGGSFFNGADFHQADLRGALFSEAKLQGAHFDRCDLRKASFADAFLPQAILTHANLMSANFDRADLTRARLENSNLYGSSLWNTILHAARWENAYITKSRLDQA